MVERLGPDNKPAKSIQKIPTPNPRQSTVTASPTNFPQVKPVRQTEVTLITALASQHGYDPEHPDAHLWCNWGQGAPETGHIPNAPPRNRTITLDDNTLEYAPVAGVKAFREKVAAYYNLQYRSGHASKYTWKNVMVTAGGRGGLTRVLGSLGGTEVGYFLPDYAAYQECLGLFASIHPTGQLYEWEESPHVQPHELAKHLEICGTGALICSNPGNPTGKVIEGEELKGMVDAARDYQCLMIFDEFYSHFYYEGLHEKDGKKGDNTMDAKNLKEDDPEDSFRFPSVSATRYIDDVNRDPILIINGLTKSWRCPGLRLCWVVGPEEVIVNITASGSFMDGGANHPFQLWALHLMEPKFIKEDALALQSHFKHKRDYMLKALDEECGITVLYRPTATFYIFGYIGNLPKGLNTDHEFVDAALTRRVICMPGSAFDINPGKRRMEQDIKFTKFIRISYGRPLPVLQQGIKSIKKLIAEYSTSAKL